MADHKVGVASTLLQDGQMTRIELDGQAIVLARAGGQYYAIGGNCSHYGAPLDEGLLKGHMVMCPWHHACFDIRSGARLEPPALNDIPHYPVRIDGDQVVVTLAQDNETEPQGKADGSDNRTFVIVGGGSAGNAAAEELRRAGFKGKIVMISAVPDVPVDRPNLSKDYLNGHADPAWIPLRGKEWYAERDIELRLDTRVSAVNPSAHTITFGGETVRYDKLLLATGGAPLQLKNTPGIDLDGIYTLRSLADSDRIIAAAEKGKNVVVVGASFIGMEVAASLASGRGCSVTVVGMEAVPFHNTMGDEVGRMLREEHEANGVKFSLSSLVASFQGKDGKVSGVELRSGKTIPADFVVLGVGVSPVTDYLASSGLKLDDKDKSVRVNHLLQASDPDIYAAGDIARWDDGSDRGKRIEHWRTAEQHGMVAARNMLDGAENINNHVPFFWTNQWSIILDYVGHAESWDEIVFRGGKPADKKFMAFYLKDGKPLAVSGSGYDKELDAIEIILRDKLPLTKDQIQDEAFDLIRHATQ
jgi:apoptosis-inducing factor 3